MCITNLNKKKLVIFKRPWRKIVRKRCFGKWLGIKYLFLVLWAFITFNLAKQKVQTSIERIGLNCMFFTQHVYFSKWRNWTKLISLNIIPSSSQLVLKMNGETLKIIFIVHTVMVNSCNLRSVVRGGFQTGQINVWFTKTAVYNVTNKCLFWSADHINTLAISQLGSPRKSQLSRFKQFPLSRQYLTHQTVKCRLCSHQFNPYNWSSTMEYQQLFSVLYTINFIILHRHMFLHRRCQPPQSLLRSLTKPWRPKHLR